jgi:hypothetical protein
MADRVRKISYCYVTVPSRAGHGAEVLGELRNAGVNLTAFTGFPAKKGKAQLDIVCDDMTGVRRVARSRGWKVSKVKKAFHIQGSDTIGAVNKHIAKLAEAGINVTAADAVAAGRGRYGMILWVRPKDYARAARTLKAK